MSENDEVKALQQAILERAKTLSEEHVEQGNMTRGRIIRDAREKVKLMEQKELLAARLKSDREYKLTTLLNWSTALRSRSRRPGPSGRAR